MLLTGAQVVIECLKEQGVDTVFGYPGGAILNIYDELYKNRDSIHHILTSHEQGAAHAADGYARSTGKVGVCFATSGPGATNLVTGIGTAYMDSIPVVAITCNVTVPLLGKDSFQEVDIAGITMPITKHNFIVKDKNKLAATIRRAFRIAKTGRPGPVLVDIPKDITSASMDFEPQKAEIIEPLTDQITDEGLDQVIDMINDSKRPYIFVGGGAVLADAEQETREFVHRLNAPVGDSLMGKGVIDGNDPLYTGPVGMHGTKTSDLAISRCDLLLALGTRFSDRVTGSVDSFAPSAKIVHIDVDAAEINKNIQTDAHIIGDLKVVLQKLLERLEQKDHAEWLKEVEHLKKTYPLVYSKEGLSGPAVVEEIYHQTKGDAIIVAEVGQHEMWAAQYYKFKSPRTFLTPGGLGTMGYGLGAAIGAQIANPQKQVINIAGDGCFRMNMNEMATAAREHVPLIEIIMDNETLGMVHQWQELFYEGRYSNTILNDATDYVKVAEALGAKGVHVHTQEEFADAFHNALAINGPFVIDCHIPSEDNVWPMVVPGASIGDVIDEADYNRLNHK